MANSPFARGENFPSEGFVQKAVDHHFDELGFERITSGHADHARIDPATGVRWIVEAKGHTAAIGLDFRTGLGQLLQGMKEPEVRYGLAMPDTPEFRVQRERVSEWVRAALGLHWLLVDELGVVRMEDPEASRVD